MLPRALYVALLTATLTGCATPLPQIASPGPGCNVRGGLVVPEGSAGAGFGGATVAAAGASASIIGECPPGFAVFERTPGGGWLYYGDPELLKWWFEHQPVRVTASQLREIANGQ